MVQLAAWCCGLRERRKRSLIQVHQPSVKQPHVVLRLVDRHIGWVAIVAVLIITRSC